MIGDSLMDGADEVRSGGSGEWEAEFAGAVGLGCGGYVHAAAEVDEKDLVAGSGLARGAVGYGTG